MTPKEFRELGYLEEVNRRFFHPMGLSMCFTEHDDGTETFTGFLEGTDDEGWVMGYQSYPDPDRAHEIAIERARKWDAEWESRRRVREYRFGWMVQPPGVDAPDVSPEEQS
jgi:hypothetical protein